MGHSLSLTPLTQIPLPGQGCCQSHPLLFQFLLDSLLSVHCQVRQTLTSSENVRAHLGELLGLSPSDSWLGRVGPLAKLRSYSALYAEQEIKWKRPAVRVARQAQQVLDLALRCHAHPTGGSQLIRTKLVTLVDQLAQQLLTLLEHYHDDERVLLLLVRRQECLAHLYGPTFLSDLFQQAHGSHEQGLQLMHERLKARGYDIGHRTHRK